MELVTQSLVVEEVPPTETHLRAVSVSTLLQFQLLFNTDYKCFKQWTYIRKGLQTRSSTVQKRLSCWQCAWCSWLSTFARHTFVHPSCRWTPRDACSANQRHRHLSEDFTFVKDYTNLKGHNSPINALGMVILSHILSRTSSPESGLAIARTTTGISVRTLKCISSIVPTQI